MLTRSTKNANAKAPPATSSGSFTSTYTQASSSSTTDPTISYIQKQTALLRQLSTNTKKDSEDLANFLQEFCQNFPGSDKEIIHFQDKEEFSLFAKEVFEALNNKRCGVTSGTYNLCKRTHNKNNQCVEANILQSIAKLRIPMNLKTNQRLGSTSFAEIMQELVDRAANYFNNPINRNQFNHLTFTLSALTNIDIDQFRIQSKAKSFFDEDKDFNPLIDDFVKVALGHIDSNLYAWPADSLIRAVHSIIILSKANAGFSNYLSSDLARDILNVIDNNLHALSTANTHDVHLAQQLFQIRNIYADVFPPRLSSSIAPFTQTLNQSTHGSNFENIVFKTLLQAAKEHLSQYPTLIDQRLFNKSNPISEALGLESDITYENGLVRACIQVDGDKYHTYHGSKRQTQRTLLRDHCFLQDGWQLIKFTDSQKDKATASQFLIDAIIIPTYEAKTKLFLAQHDRFQENIESLEATISKVEQNDLKMRQFYQALQALNSRVPYGSEHYQTFSELSARYNHLAKHMRLAFDAKNAFNAIHAQLNTADVSKAREYVNISSLLNEAKSKIAYHSSNLEQQQMVISKLTIEIKECSEKLSLSKEQLAELEESKRPLAAQMRVVLRNEKKLELAKEELAAFRKNTDPKKVKPALGNLEIKEQTIDLESQKGEIQRELDAKRVESSKLKNIMCQQQEALRQLEKKQKEFQTEIQNKKDDENLRHFQAKLQEFETALQSPVLGEHLMAHFKTVSELDAMSGELNEGLDSDLQRIKELEANLDNEDLRTKFAKQSLQEQPRTRETAMPRADSRMHFRAPTQEEIAYQQHMHYLYQQQMAYQLQRQQLHQPSQSFYLPQNRKPVSNLSPLSPAYTPNFNSSKEISDEPAVTKEQGKVEASRRYKKAVRAF